MTVPSAQREGYDDDSAGEDRDYKGQLVLVHGLRPWRRSYHMTGRLA